MAGSLIEFQTKFADEETCVVFLFEHRWPEGFICPACGGFDAWRLGSRPVWECRGCGRQTSITVGTLMQNTKLPLRVWFWAAYLMATHSNGLSALQLKGLLGLNYRTAWLLESKLRRAMVDPDRGLLTGLVEIDQTEIPFREKNPPEDVGGRAGMLTVIGAVEVVNRPSGRTPVYRPGRQLLNTKPGRVRLEVIPDNRAATLEAFIREKVAPGTVILTDDHRSYGRLNQLGYRHYPHLIGPMAAHLVLPWIHRVFSLLKRWGLGVYHGLRRKHLQVYLEEYTFRFNRRRLRKISFDKLLGLTVFHPPEPYHRITGKAARKTSDEVKKRAEDMADMGMPMIPQKTKPKRRRTGV